MVALLKDPSGEDNVHTDSTYLIPAQKSAIHCVTRPMISSIATPAWEKRALSMAIRVVRSSPMNVCRVFEQLAHQTPCQCHAPPPPGSLGLQPSSMIMLPTPPF